MNIRYPRLFNIIIIAAIPFLIAGLFVYRNIFAGPLSHSRIILFLASSIIPAIASMALAVCIQILPSSILRANGEEPGERKVQILAGITLVLALWAAIAATEALLRLFYFGIWGSNVAGISLFSTSTIVLGILASILIVVLSLQEVNRLEAA